MYLHADPVMYVLRLYREPDGYDRREPYEAIVSVSIVGDVAMLYGLHGRFSRAAWRSVEEWLREHGVESALIERRGRIRELR